MPHSTVQTLLRQLEAKGAVDHVVTAGKGVGTYVYRPLFGRSEATQSAVTDVLVRLFGGSVSTFLQHLLQHEEFTDEELYRMRQFLRERQQSMAECEPAV